MTLKALSGISYNTLVEKWVVKLAEIHRRHLSRRVASIAGFIDLGYASDTIHVLFSLTVPPLYLQRPAAGFKKVCT